MYILKIFSQERWLKHVGIGKVFFPHHSWLQCTKLSEFMVGWLLGGKINRGVSLALDKKRQHFGDPQLSPLLFQGEFVGEGMHRKEVRQQLLSASDAARAECRGGGQRSLIQPNTGTGTQGIREEQSYLGSSSHAPAQGHHCQAWKGGYFPTQPSKFVHFPSTNKTLPRSQFWNSLHSLSMWAKEVTISHTPLHTCEGWWQSSIGIILQTCCKTKVLGSITYDT